MRAEGATGALHLGPELRVNAGDPIIECDDVNRTKDRFHASPSRSTVGIVRAEDAVKQLRDGDRGDGGLLAAGRDQRLALQADQVGRVEDDAQGSRGFPCDRRM